MRFDAIVEGRTVAVEVRGRDGRYAVTVDGRPLSVDLQDFHHDAAGVLVFVEGRSYDVGVERRGTGYRVLLRDDVVEVELAAAAAGTGELRRATGGPARIAAPMPGKIVRVFVAIGQDVTAGQGLVVMEAMKMENELKAPRNGRVKELAVREGQAVETGAPIAVVE